MTTRRRKMFHKTGQAPVQYVLCSCGERLEKKAKKCKKCGRKLTKESK